MQTSGDKPTLLAAVFDRRIKATPVLDLSVGAGLNLSLELVAFGETIVSGLTRPEVIRIDSSGGGRRSAPAVGGHVLHSGENGEADQCVIFDIKWHCISAPPYSPSPLRRSWIPCVSHREIIKSVAHATLLVVGRTARHPLQLRDGHLFTVLSRTYIIVCGRVGPIIEGSRVQ